MKKRPRNGPDIGFDRDADFIPLDFSDDAGPCTDLDASRHSQAFPEGWHVDANVRGPPTPASLNGQARKRKRSDVDTSPERGPSAQRRRVDGGGSGIKPWHSSVDAYTDNETARMYRVFLLSLVLMHG